MTKEEQEESRALHRRDRNSTSRQKLKSSIETFQGHTSEVRMHTFFSSPILVKQIPDKSLEISGLILEIFNDLKYGMKYSYPSEMLNKFGRSNKPVSIGSIHVFFVAVEGKKVGEIKNYCHSEWGRSHQNTLSTDFTDLFFSHKTIVAEVGKDLGKNPDSSEKLEIKRLFRTVMYHLYGFALHNTEMMGDFPSKTGPNFSGMHGDLATKLEPDFHEMISTIDRLISYQYGETK
jgi:hypothetical protein